MGLAVAITLAGAGVAHAQGVGGSSDGQQGSGMRRGGGPESMLLKGITLTADQQAQVNQLRDAARAQMGGGQGGGQGASADNGQSREQRREQRISALRAILTADQRVQFDKNVADMKANAGQHGHDG